MKQLILLLTFLTSILTFCHAQSTEKRNDDFFDEPNIVIKDTPKVPVVVTPKGIEKAENTVDAGYAESSGEGVFSMMQFDNRTIDFGKVKFGETRSHIFSFKNISNEPLTIDIVSACECTELEYTHEAIPVGGTGFVKAVFHSDRTPEAVNGTIHKDITIILKNQAKDTGYPIIEELFVKAAIVE
jgi:hypothetical protein